MPIKVKAMGFDKVLSKELSLLLLVKAKDGVEGISIKDWFSIIKVPKRSNHFLCR